MLFPFVWFLDSPRWSFLSLLSTSVSHPLWCPLSRLLLASLLSCRYRAPCPPSVMLPSCSLEIFSVFLPVMLFCHLPVFFAPAALFVKVKDIVKVVMHLSLSPGKMAVYFKYKMLILKNSSNDCFYFCITYNSI